MSEPFRRYPLLMDPWFSARPWGGRRLETLGKTLPAEPGPWGEAWELSDHPDGLSRIGNGVYEGMLFGELVRKFPEMIGRAEAPGRYPLIVKYIDAGEDLSIQVHPDTAHAPAGECGKTECWFIMDCREGAEIIHGLCDGMDADVLMEACRAGKMESCIRRVAIAPGDLIQIPAGTVHAILGGTLLCEIQQCSNTTYRLWDWDRKPARPLHVEDACRVIDYKAATHEPLHTRGLELGRWHTLARNEFFEIKLIGIEPGACRSVTAENEHGLILNIVAGRSMLMAGDYGVELRMGETWFIPAGMGEWTIFTDQEPVKILASRSLE